MCDSRVACAHLRLTCAQEGGVEALQLRERVVHEPHEYDCFDNDHVDNAEPEQAVVRLEVDALQLVEAQMIFCE